MGTTRSQFYIELLKQFKGKKQRIFKSSDTVLTELPLSVYIGEED